MLNHKPKLMIVIPTYNEEDMLPIAVPQLVNTIGSLISKELINEKSGLLFVNDGSSDNTEKLLKQYYSENSSINFISLSRNKGHQTALLSGLLEASKISDITISMDCDLQDDLGVVDKMVKMYIDGCDIVYGVRKERDTDTFFKKTSAEMFYKIQQFLGAEIIPEHADFRLMSKKAVESLGQYPESLIYLRGMVPQIGFKSGTVYYDRQIRKAGQSKYPLKAMLKLAQNGIFDFTTSLLDWILPAGIITFILGIIVSACFAIESITHSLYSPLNVIIALMTVFAGMILTALGIMARYLGRCYKEVKHRPRFFIKDTFIHEDEQYSHQ